MRSRKMRLASPCPACRQNTVDYTATELEVPYFGEILQAVFLCEGCGFRHSDVIVGRTREPKRVTFRTHSEDDLMVRVVRSTSCTVQVPELGVLIEPGPASDAYVSNIEGLLVRIEAVLQQLCRDAEGEESRRTCRERLAQLEAARQGTFPITVIFEDPFGNSLIAHDAAKTEGIPPEEAERLARGELSLDVSDLIRDATDGEGGNGGPAKQKR